MERVRIIDNPFYRLLREEKVEQFNLRKQAEEKMPSFALCDFRGLDLRGLDANGLDFSGAYFRGADLRGVDFRHCQLEGASLANTKISGCYFPQELEADEILMSMLHGTRMRYRGHLAKS